MASPDFEQMVGQINGEIPSADGNTKQLFDTHIIATHDRMSELEAAHPDKVYMNMKDAMKKYGADFPTKEVAPPAKAEGFFKRWFGGGSTIGSSFEGGFGLGSLESSTSEVAKKVEAPSAKGMSLTKKVALWTAGLTAAAYAVTALGGGSKERPSHPESTAAITPEDYNAAMSNLQNIVQDAHGFNPLLSAARKTPPAPAANWAEQVSAEAQNPSVQR